MPERTIRPETRLRGMPTSEPCHGAQPYMIPKRTTGLFLAVLLGLMGQIHCEAHHIPESRGSRGPGLTLLLDEGGKPAVARMRRFRGRSIFTTAHDGHYLFAPSAIPMEGGTGYYQNHDVVMHSAFFAPVTGMSIGVGIQLASVVTSIATGSGGPTYFARVSGSGQLGHGNAYLGGFAMGFRASIRLPFEERKGIQRTYGLFAAQGTFGTDPLHVTISIGVAMDDDGFGNGPLIGLSGLWRIVDRVAVITENWNLPFGPENYRVFSYGARINHRAMAFDAAFAINNDLKDFFILGLPIIGYSIRF